MRLCSQSTNTRGKTSDYCLVYVSGDTRRVSVPNVVRPAGPGMTTAYERAARLANGTWWELPDDDTEEVEPDPDSAYDRYREDQDL